jgi:hypothetical protein
MIDAADSNDTVTETTVPPPGDAPVDTRLTWMNWGLVGLAVLLRTIRYLHDHGLWLDEAYLALNLIHRPFSELVTELDYEQYAPVGFLFAMKGIIVTLGTSDYVFRLLPFLASLVSVFLYYAVARQLLSRTAVPVALGLFTLSYPFLIYAAETKPYGSDATIALLLTFLVSRYLARDRPGIRDAALLAVAGSVSVWFSFPAAFVLATAGIVLGIRAVWQRDWRSVAMLGAVGAVWLVSFGAQASFLLGSEQSQLPETDLEHLRAYYSADFFPWPPGPGRVLEWLMHVIPTLIGYFTSEVMAGVGVFALLLGCIRFGVTRRAALVILLGPVIVTMLVSAKYLYPMTDRFMVFAGPALLLVIAAGFEEIRVRVGPRGRLVWVLLLVTLLFQPTLRAVKQSVRLERHGDARAAVARLDDAVQPADTIYLYWTGEPLYRLYSKHPHPESLIVSGRRSERWAAHAQDLELLYGKPRVWVLFSFNAQYSAAGLTIRDELDRRGEILDSFESAGAALYLYDLSVPPNSQSP